MERKTDMDKAKEIDMNKNPGQYVSHNMTNRDMALFANNKSPSRQRQHEEAAEGCGYLGVYSSHLLRSHVPSSIKAVAKEELNAVQYALDAALNDATLLRTK
jgi:sensor domain CHASE-containing protein